MVHLPQNGTIGFDQQPCLHQRCLFLSHPSPHSLSVCCHSKRCDFWAHALLHCKFMRNPVSQTNDDFLIRWAPCEECRVASKERGTDGWAHCKRKPEKTSHHEQTCTVKIAQKVMIKSCIIQKGCLRTPAPFPFELS